MKTTCPTCQLLGITERGSSVANIVHTSVADGITSAKRAHPDVLAAAIVHMVLAEDKRKSLQQAMARLLRKTLKDSLIGEVSSEVPS